MKPVIQQQSLLSPVAQSLIAELNAELDQRYPEEGANHFRLDETELAPGRGVFLVAYVEGQAVGCGAVRINEPGVGEIKRMYVAPSWRGKGIAGAVLGSLEEHALRLGARRLVLETGDRQSEVLQLYRRAGFIDIPRFGEYVSSPMSVCMGKTLSA